MDNTSLQELNSENKLPQVDFLFLGGNLALDLVNSKRSRRLPGSKRIIQFDQLWDKAELESWWRSACAKYALRPCEAYKWTQEDFESLIALRAELRVLFEAVAAGAFASMEAPLLNAALAEGSYVLGFSAEGPKRDYSSRKGLADPLLAVALAAAELLAEGELSRIRGCRSERCVLMFYDSTKSGTRHWCRPECMNRSRARANYRKAKEGGTA
jgi:predicted RNA-binding Zn ribbon-like protein